jgi:hypothetical protein
MKWDRAAWNQRGGRMNSIWFREFRLDLANQCLWRRGDSGQEARVALAPKAFDVLRYLCLVIRKLTGVGQPRHRQHFPRSNDPYGRLGRRKASTSVHKDRR